MSNERFLAAAQRVLDGDESTGAAAELEQAVRADFPGDERVDELVEVLERYAAVPGGLSTVPEQVRTVIRETIARVM